MLKLYNKTFNNIVCAAGASPVRVVKNECINYNTYLQLTPLFKSLIVSTNNGGKYSLKVTDADMGFYFNYKELNLSIKVPLTAVFNTNDKIKGILGIKWATAIECPSRLRGLCQLDDPQDCYAYSGELQGSKRGGNHLMGMGSYFNSLLCVYYFNLFYHDGAVRHTFKRYCNYYGVDTLRFNLSGDFKDLKDIDNLNHLADMGLNLTGYTARDDLREAILKVMNNHDNIILNGSNLMYTNKFEATDNIKEYFTAQHYCRGGCLSNGCLNCYNKRGIKIIVLIHGSSSGTTLNTPANREFITDILNAAGVNITVNDLLRFKDIYRSLNTYFKTNNLFESVPAAFKKLNKSGEVVFEGHNSTINYLRVLYNKYMGEL